MRESNLLTYRARMLRQEMTDAERLLWRHLRSRALDGHKFPRQVVIEPYIVDFACLDAHLIVEADGGQHSQRRQYDGERTAYLVAMGYRVLRFWNHEILKELESVLEQIRLALNDTPSPQPLSQKERG